MSPRAPGVRPQWLLPGLLPVLGGGLIAVLAVVVSGSMPFPLIVAAIGAVGLALPALLIKDLSLAVLAAYVFLLPFEASKRVIGTGQSPADVLSSLGLPPSTLIGVKLFPTDLLLVPLFLMWAFALKKRKVRFRFPWPVPILVAFLAWMTLTSFLKAEHPELSLAQLVHEYKFLLVFLYFLSVLDSVPRIRFVVVVVLVTLAMELSVSLGLYGMGHSRDSLAETLNLGVSHDFEYLRTEEKSYRESGSNPDFRASGTFGAASHLAMYLQLMFPLPLALLVTSRGYGWKVLHGVLFILAAFTLYATLSRAGLLGLVTGTAVCVILLRLRGYIPKRVFLGMAYATLAVVLSQTPGLYRHMENRPYTFWHRFELSREGVNIILANPVLGVGANNSTAARVKQAAERPYETHSTSDMVAVDNLYPIHNQFIVVAAETGLVGFALGALLFVALTLEAIRLSRSRDPLVASLAIATVSGYVGLGTQLLGDHFVGNAQHTMLWMFAALVLGLRRLDQTDSIPIPASVNSG